MGEHKKTPAKFSATGNCGYVAQLQTGEVYSWTTSPYGKLITVQPTLSHDAVVKSGVNVVVVNPMQPHLSDVDVDLSLDVHAIYVPESFQAKITARQDCRVLIESMGTAHLDSDNDALVVDHRSDLVYGLYPGESIHEQSGVTKFRAEGPDVITASVGIEYDDQNVRHTIIKVGGTSDYFLADEEDVEIFVEQGSARIDIEHPGNCPPRSFEVFHNNPAGISRGERFRFVSHGDMPMIGRITEIGGRNLEARTLKNTSQHFTK